jgi:hypothetical protein
VQLLGQPAVGGALGPSGGRRAVHVSHVETAETAETAGTTGCAPLARQSATVLVAAPACP